MKDRMERFVLLPFAVGCISESSIPIGIQHANTAHSIPTNPSLSRNSFKHRGIHQGVNEDEYFNDSLKDENLKTALPRFQKLFKNFKNLSHLFVYKVELEEEMGMEIGVPTDVKHVTHIGLDDCASSIFSKSSLINLHSLHQKEIEFAMATQDETRDDLRSLFETKCRN